MARLASSITNIKQHYDVIVIGSGYGGSISASRMARAGKSVCLLEKGKEIQPGEYPEKEWQAKNEMQIDLPGRHIGKQTGLYDFRVNKDINVFQGCGLGGTSLVNANVALEAYDWVLSEEVWPKDLRNDEGTLRDGFQRAKEMLKPQPYPDNWPVPAKLKAMEQSAKGLQEGSFYRTPINVTFEDGLNHVGVIQHACNGCGDCVTGCNYRAKNTTLMNYIPDAKNHGAEIFTEVDVRYLERENDTWLVHYHLADSGQKKFGEQTLFVSAGMVILGAGSLGSTEILLRSGEQGLDLSNRVGHRFTGNGDFLGFGYNNDVRANAIGMGHKEPDPGDPVGPCITGIIDLRNGSEKNGEGMVIEEGVAPGPISAIMAPALEFAANTIGLDTDSGFADFFRELWRKFRSLFGGAYTGAVENTMTYLVMTHDDGNGKMYLEDDRVRIDWPGVGEQSIFQKVSDTLRKITTYLGGTYIKNPTWNKLFKHRLTTVHPLGGCVMGDSAEQGVVNHKGQVYSGKHGTAVYENLYVNDGAIVPRTLGVNPLLTISALAERNCHYIAKDRNWSIDYSFGEYEASPEVSQKPGLKFTEKMTGYISTTEKGNFQEAFEKGKEKNSECSFTLTIISDDLEGMLADEKHTARMVGTLNAPALEDEPLTVNNGLFNLLEKSNESVDTHTMQYRMNLTSEQGKEYYFHGYKVIHDDPGFDMWADTTTLFITIHKGRDEQDPVVGKGILKIRPQDFRKQMTTMKVTNVDNLGERLRYMRKFGKFFSDILFETYGDSFAGQSYFVPEGPPRDRRSLRAPEPEVYRIKTEDDVSLRLTRYRGGQKGPVILSHGLGVSGKIFSTDMIKTNLVEYLSERNYDVWLLDYRASIELPAANTQFSADDIAKYDYPAAVRNVLEITGAKDVQMVVHCYGATSWTMSMLGGWLNNVRGAVVSQVSTHIKVPFLTKMKTGLYVPDFLNKIGVDSLTAYVDKESNWVEKLFDDAVQFYPFQDEEECNNPVCHRITFLYGHLYEHDQLNDLTHQNLHELFGVANIESFEHLALLTRKGYVVNADGDEAYLPYAERMAIPITFISGQENECFLPDSTNQTVKFLSAANAPDFYNRVVIPDYGHIDCIFGKNAVADVYPHIYQHLENTQ